MRRLFLTLIPGFLLAVTLVSCGGGGGGSATGGGEITPIALTVPATQVLPATPLALQTSGLAADLSANPVTVTFSGTSTAPTPAFSATLTPLHVYPDGTVVVPVPLYMDLGSKKITQGNVQVVVTQGNRSSSPKPLMISGLPDLSSIPLGSITRAMVTGNALLAQRRITQLQFWNLIASGNVDISALQKVEKAYLDNTIQWRNALDAFLADSTQVIPAIRLPNGGVINFTKEDIAVMDQIYAIWIYEEFLNSSPVATPTGTMHSSAQDKAVTAAFDVKNVQAILDSLNNLTTIADTTKTVGDNESEASDKALAAINGVLATATIAANATGGALPGLLGMAGSVLTLPKTFHDCDADLEKLNQKIQNGTYQVSDGDTVTRNIEVQAANVVVGTALAATTALFPPSVIVTAPVGIIVYFANQYYSSISDIDKTTAQSFKNVFPVNPGFISQGAGTVTGTVTSQATGSLDLVYATMQTQGSFSYNTLTDKNGRWGFIVPKWMEGSTFPSPNTITFTDPVGRYTTSTATVVDLTGLDPNIPMIVPAATFDSTPPLTGTWTGTWTWSGTGSNGCSFNDGGSFSMTLAQTGTSFSGSTSGSGIQTRDNATCALTSTDSGSGSVSGTISGTALNLSFDLSGSVTTLSFYGTATLSGNTLTGSFVRNTGGSGSFTLTRQ